jgi:hypothetical protein
MELTDVFTANPISLPLYEENEPPQRGKLTEDDLAQALKFKNRVYANTTTEVQTWRLDKDGSTKGKKILFHEYQKKVDERQYHQNVSTADFDVRFFDVEGNVPLDLEKGCAYKWTVDASLPPDEDFLLGGPKSMTGMHLDTPIPWATYITVSIG